VLLYSRVYLTTLTVSDHTVCCSDTPTGCQHCIISPSLVCCEGCHPRLFDEFAVADPALRPVPRPARSRIQSSYKATSKDMELTDALHDFRKRKTTEKFGRSVLKNAGPGVIMPNATLDRIVDCAHYGKIQSIDELMKETRWNYSSEYGKDILILIRMSHPAAPPPNNPLQPSMTAPSSNQAPKAIKQRVCSKCQSTGHIGESERK
jgi:hypothetical protein